MPECPACYSLTLAPFRPASPYPAPPTTDVNKAGLPRQRESNTTDADKADKLSNSLRKQAQKATCDRDKHLPTINESVRSTRHVLMGLHRDNPDTLGGFDFDFDFDVADADAASPPAPASVK